MRRTASRGHVPRPPSAERVRATCVPGCTARTAENPCDPQAVWRIGSDLATARPSQWEFQLNFFASHGRPTAFQPPWRAPKHVGHFKRPGLIRVYLTDVAARSKPPCPTGCSFLHPGVVDMNEPNAPLEINCHSLMAVNHYPAVRKTWNLPQLRVARAQHFISGIGRVHCRREAPARWLTGAHNSCFFLYYP